MERWRSSSEPAEPLVELLEALAHRGGDGHGVRATFFIDGDLDRLLAVDPADHLTLFVTAGDSFAMSSRRMSRRVLSITMWRMSDGPLELVDRAHEVFGLARPEAGRR